MNLMISASVVAGSCIIILLSRYCNLKEKVQNPLEWMAIGAIVVFGAAFLYSLLQYQDNRYKASDRRNAEEAKYEEHSKLPEVATILMEIKAEYASLNKDTQTRT